MLVLTIDRCKLKNKNKQHTLHFKDIYYALNINVKQIKK